MNFFKEKKKIFLLYVIVFTILAVIACNFFDLEEWLIKLIGTLTTINWLFFIYYNKINSSDKKITI